MNTKQRKTENSAIALKDNSSPATKYLLSVLEKKTHEDTFPSAECSVERVVSAFKALTDILPHCGIYSPVLKLVKEELFEAVYSNTYTVSEKPAEKNKPPPLERIPYFALLRRFQDHRNETRESLQSEIDALISTIKLHEQKERELEKTQQNLKKKIDKLEDNLKKSNSIIKEDNSEIYRLKEEIEGLKLQHEYDMMDAKEELEKTISKRDYFNQQMTNLLPYKNTYDTLKDTFDLPVDKRPRRGFRRPILMTKKTQLLCNIEAASKLEQQILEVQNKTVEEYDIFLEGVKSNLSHHKFAESKSDPNYYNEELQLENMSDEMSSRLKNFQRLISGLVVEFELIKQHRETLQNELTQLEQVEMGSRAIVDGEGISTAGTMPPSSMAGRPGSSRMMLLDDGLKKHGRESRLSLEESGLEEDHSPMTDSASDPFNPQEKVLSKYSAMIYTSRNGGRSFDEITLAKFCISCGGKTAICPHKITKQDLIIQLPKACTHIKVVRPQVRMITSISQQGPPMTASTTNVGTDNWFSGRNNSSWGMNEQWMAEEQNKPQLASLWDDFKQRTGTEKSLLAPVSRDLSLSRTLSLMEQFYSSVIYKDDLASSRQGVPEEDLGTFKDYLYKFMFERYQEDEVMPLGTYDFLTAIIKYSQHDKIILVFALVLTGNIDGSVARYIHLVADLINMINWEEVEDFHAFAECLYPFLHEEDIDQLCIEFTAFTENKISKKLVMNYVIHAILKNKEPRFQDAEGMLSTTITTDEGVMTMEEYILSMEANSPLANVRLWKKLMKETFKTVGENTVQITRLAVITAYVNLVQVIALLKENISGKVEETRKSYQASRGNSRLDKKIALVNDDTSLITMHDMRILASNISRQRSSAMQQASQFDDMFWSSRPNTEGGLA